MLLIGSFYNAYAKKVRGQTQGEIRQNSLFTLG